MPYVPHALPSCILAIGNQQLIALYTTRPYTVTTFSCTWPIIGVGPSHQS